MQVMQAAGQNVLAFGEPIAIGTTFFTCAGCEICQYRAASLGVTISR
jgi:hypothetical protein